MRRGNAARALVPSRHCRAEDRAHGALSGSIDLILGWSLDPGNPRHHGWNAPWDRAKDNPACLVPGRQVEGSVLRNIASQWSFFVRFGVGAPVAMHLSLAGSSGAMKKACRRGRSATKAKRRREEPVRNP